jgi:hypothetical protein
MTAHRSPELASCPSVYMTLTWRPSCSTSSEPIALIGLGSPMARPVRATTFAPWVNRDRGWEVVGLTAGRGRVHNLWWSEEADGGGGG